MAANGFIDIRRHAIDGVPVTCGVISQTQTSTFLVESRNHDASRRDRPTVPETPARQISLLLGCLRLEKFIYQLSRIE